MSHELLTADHRSNFVHDATPAPAHGITMRGTIITGLLVIGLTFGGFGTWAAMAPLMSAVVASGSVKVQSNRKKLQHIEGGVVREIHVNDGDVVTQGAVLIRLDDTHARSTMDKVRAKLDSSRARAARLSCEKVWCAKVEFPAELVARADNLPDVKAALLNEEASFNARRETAEGEVSIMNQKILQLDKQTIGETAQLNSKKRQIFLIREELDGVEALLKKGLIEKPRVIALQREAARLEGEVGQHVAEMARVATQVSEAQLKIMQVRRTFQETVVDSLREIENEIPELETKLAEARHTLDQIEIRAPVSGVVVGLDVHTKGGVVAPGQTILEIVPGDDRLMVEARVAVRDVENLEIGQTAHVRLTALKQRTAPDVIGKLAYISADSLSDERTMQSYYLVRIAVSDEALAAAGLPRMQAGMPADVMIATGERTVLSYLSQPLMDGLSRTWRED